MRVTREYAQAKLEERQARLRRFQEIGAPAIVIEAERRLVRDAIYMLETGEMKVTKAPYDRDA